MSQDHKDLYNAIAGGLDDILNGPVRPRRLAFVVLVAEIGKIDNGKVNYVSNANKQDILAMMKEYIARAEGRHVEGPETKQ